MPSYDGQQFQPPAPVAVVTLRTKDGRKSLGDVVMQIDSGADVSLIPESLVRLLELDTSDQKDYELTGFDGNKSFARSVQCELIFLRRAFRGAYLIVENTTGILGRDVLNHISLVLDGPRQNWREEHAAA
jgi:hypothetical protein